MIYILVGENGLGVIGLYPLTNIGTIVVHEISEDKVVASLNGGEPEECLTELSWERVEGWQTGFRWGSLFIPFDEIMRC